MNYEEMSDFEINELVAIARVVDAHRFHCDAVNGTGCTDGILYHFDYCNDPSDAWPIIVEHKIATEWHHADLWRAQCDNQFGSGPYKVWTNYCHNPLRAAMICFLKMKDSES